MAKKPRQHLWPFGAELDPNQIPILRDVLFKGAVLLPIDDQVKLTSATIGTWIPVFQGSATGEPNCSLVEMEPSVGEEASEIRIGTRLALELRVDVNLSISMRVDVSLRIG
jgi:hypothetical protein